MIHELEKQHVDNNKTIQIIFVLSLFKKVNEGTLEINYNAINNIFDSSNISYDELLFNLFIIICSLEDISLLDFIKGYIIFLKNNLNIKNCKNNMNMIVKIEDNIELQRKKSNSEFIEKEIIKK